MQFDTRLKSRIVFVRLGELSCDVELNGGVSQQLGEDEEEEEELKDASSNPLL